MELRAFDGLAFNGLEVGGGKWAGVEDAFCKLRSVTIGLMFLVSSVPLDSKSF
jgi:hypothetical protein